MFALACVVCAAGYIAAGVWFLERGHLTLAILFAVVFGAGWLVLAALDALGVRRVRKASTKEASHG